MIPVRSCLDCGADVRGSSRCPRCSKTRDRGKDQARGGSTRRKAWRRAVFAKSGGRCVKCGAPAAVADHIQRVVDRPDLALDVANGRALCRPCDLRFGS